MRYKGTSTEINISMKICIINLYFINICMERKERTYNQSHILYIPYRSNMCKVLFTKNKKKKKDKITHSPLGIAEDTHLAEFSRKPRTIPPKHVSGKQRHLNIPYIQ